MAKDEIHPEHGEAVYFAESIRLLWEGTRNVVYGGIDTKDLASLCDIIIRLADDRLLYIQVKCDPNSAEIEEAAKQIRQYREQAAEIHRRTSKPAPEPDWAAITASLSSDGAAPLELR